MQEKRDIATTGDIEQIVVFELAGEQYGVNIQSVQEIIKMVNITKVPRTKIFVEGVINLRGRVIPIIDLRKRFELAVSKITPEMRIVVVEIAGIVIGMIVDAVMEVLRIPSSSIEPPSPVVSNINSNFIKGVGKFNDRLIIMLNVEEVLSDKEKEHLTQVSAKIDEDQLQLEEGDQDKKAKKK